MPTISANGWRAPNRRIQVSLSARSMGYGISLITFGLNSVYFHGGEMPGFNSFMGYDRVNDVALVVWTNLTLSLDGQHTANSIMLKMLAQIYTVSPLQ
jgi:D-alanyl-D-alanine carboxypeptidase